MLCKTLLGVSLTSVVALASPLDLPLSTCEVTATNPPPSGYHCGTLGKLNKPLLLSSLPALTLDDCVSSCKVDNRNKCISFGYNAETKECNLFKKTLNKQGYKDKVSDNGVTYYNRRCFQVQCEAIPPPVPIPDPPVDPCELFIQPPGDQVTNGGFECGLDPWHRDSFGSYISGKPTAPGSDGSSASFHAAGFSENIIDRSQIVLTQSIELLGGDHEVSFLLQFTGPDQLVEFYLGGVKYASISGEDSGPLNQFNRFSYATSTVGFDVAIQFQFYGLRTSQPDIYLDNVSVIPAVITNNGGDN